MDSVDKFGSEIGSDNFVILNFSQRLSPTVVPKSPYNGGSDLITVFIWIGIVAPTITYIWRLILSLLARVCVFMCLCVTHWHCLFVIVTMYVKIITARIAIGYPLMGFDVKIG